ncbi:hypothetical protein GCM10020331_021010 [Ectobacillus funiculus]
MKQRTRMERVAHLLRRLQLSWQKGNSINAAVQTAKDFIQAAIENQLGIGNGHGPTNHWAYQQKQHVQR